MPFFIRGGRSLARPLAKQAPNAPYTPLPGSTSWSLALASGGFGGSRRPKTPVLAAPSEGRRRFLCQLPIWFRMGNQAASASCASYL
jgi:hypothetical protein